MNKVYAFEWCDCIYESAFRVVSLHRTLKGATKARQKELISREKEYKRRWRYRGGRADRVEFEKLGRTSLNKPFTHEKWRIKTIIVEE